MMSLDYDVTGLIWLICSILTVYSLATHTIVYTHGDYEMRMPFRHRWHFLYENIEIGYIAVSIYTTSSFGGEFKDMAGFI